MRVILPPPSPTRLEGGEEAASGETRTLQSLLTANHDEVHMHPDPDRLTQNDPEGRALAMFGTRFREMQAAMPDVAERLQDLAQQHSP
jgi:hypothetical protein